MDPEFSRLVDEAANIAAPSRWAAVNEGIKHLAANSGADNDWWVQLFASLCSQVKESSGAVSLVFVLLEE